MTIAGSDSLRPSVTTFCVTTNTGSVMVPSVDEVIATAKGAVGIVKVQPVQPHH